MDQLGGGERKNGLVIGFETDRRNVLLQVDPKSALNHTIIVGQSGSGKSYFVSRLIEEILVRTRARVVVLDSNGDFRELSKPSESVWRRKTTHEMLAHVAKLAGVGYPEPATSTYDDAADFAAAWNSRPLCYLSTALTGEKAVGHTLQAQLTLHWGELGEERDFLLRIDPAVQPQAMLGLSACVEALGYMIRERWEHIRPDLKGLEHACSMFANQELPIQKYPYAKSLTRDDWFTTRAHIRNLHKKHEALWYEPADEQSPRPRGLCAFVDQAFPDQGDAEADWAALIVGIDREETYNSRVVADVVLWKLWSRARRAAQRRQGAGSESSDDDRVPVFIVVDEAHNFAPKDTDDPMTKKTTERLLQIASEGRKYGLYLILATQRPSKLHPGLVAECENQCFLRIQAAVEHEFAAKILGIDTQLAAETSKFAAGHALLAGRWVGGSYVKATLAPARTIVGGGGLGDTWFMQPDLSKPADVIPSVPTTVAEATTDVQRIMKKVLHVVTESPRPVDLAELARLANLEVEGKGPETAWFGHGTFLTLLEMNRTGTDLEISPVQPGYAYLPGKHDTPKPRAPRSLEGVPAVARVLAEKMDLPLLEPNVYADVFGAISDDVAKHGYSLFQTSKNVRDACRQHAVARQDINFILRGLVRTGHVFAREHWTNPENLSQRFADSVIEYAAELEISLTDEEKSAVRVWVGGNAAN